MLSVGSQVDHRFALRIEGDDIDERFVARVARLARRGALLGLNGQRLASGWNDVVIAGVALLQAVSVAYHRFLRRHGRQLVDRHTRERRTGQHEAGRRHRQGDFQRESTGGVFRSWHPPSIAKLATPDR